MKRQFTFFIISALLHFGFFYWFIHISFAVKNFERREKITEIVLVSREKLWIPTLELPVQEGFNSDARPADKKSPAIRSSDSKVEAAAVDSDTQQPEGIFKEVQFSVSGGGKERLSVDLELSLKSEIDFLPDFDEIRQSLEEKEIVQKYNLGRYLWPYPQVHSNTGGLSLSSIDDPHYLAGDPSGINAHRCNIEPWARQVVNKIQLNWSVPLASAIGFNGKVGILTMIQRNGNVLRTEIRDSSNQDILDQAAQLAIHASTPLPEFPDDCPLSAIEAYFVFEYGEE